jgi:hypothetical protein
MMDKFAILLADLSALIDVELHPDHNRCCALNVNNVMHVQLQEEENKDRILIGAFLGELPPGKFREILLKETLKENNLFSRVGVFCYSPRNNQLAFFSYFPLSTLTANLLADSLEAFLDRAFSWKTALETGQIPARGTNLQKTGPSIFDIQKK